MPYPGFDVNDRFMGTQEEELAYFQEFKKKYQFPHPIDHHQWLVHYCAPDPAPALIPYQGQKCYAIHSTL